MNKKSHIFNLFFYSCLLWGSFFLLPQVGKSQTVVAQESSALGSLAEALWQHGEEEWQHSMIHVLSTDPDSLRQFLEFNQTTYFNDRGEFFNAVMEGKISKDNTGPYFQFMTDKYEALWNDAGSLQQEGMRGGKDSMPLLPVNACNPSCFNINFQTKTLTGWSAYYAVDGSTSTTIIINGKTGGACGAVTQAGGPNPNTGNTYHVQLMTTPGSDPVAGAFIPFTPPLGGVAARIGDGTRNGYGVGILEQTYVVDASAPILTVQYAVVMENPSHNGNQQPWFKMEVLDQNGNSVSTCGQYFVVSGPGLPGFKAFTYGGSTVYARPWTTAFVPLYSLIGQCITVRFTASDCALGGHFGYAYVAATCSKLDLVPSTNIFCIGQKPGTITGPPGAASYQWTTNGGCISGSSTNQIVTITCGGTYSLVTQSSAGPQCVDTFSVFIKDVPTGPPPTPCFSATRVCAASPTNFNATCAIPQAGTKFYWDFYGSGTFNDSSGATPTWTYNVGGTYSVRMFMRTALGCEADTVIKVIVDAPTVNTLPTFVTTVTNSGVCGTCTGKFEINILKGVLIDTVKTSFDTTKVVLVPNAGDTVKGGIKFCGAQPGAGFKSNKISFCNLCPGSYKIYIVPASATPPSNCAPGGFYGDTITFAISSAGGITITAGINSSNASCGANNGSASLTGFGGTGPYTFLWSNPNLGTGDSKTGLAPGNYDVQITDASGCVGNTTVTINNSSQLSALISPFDVSCFGANDGSIKVTPTAGIQPYTYSWSHSSNTTDSAGALAAGSYTVYLTDGSGCTGSVNAVIKQPTEVIGSITSSVTSVPCGQTGNATATAIGGYPPYTYKWSSGGLTSSVTGLQPGTHIVTIADGLGCQDTLHVTVTTINGPTVTASPDTGICPNGQTVLSANSATGGITYEWAPGTSLSCTTCSSPTASPTATTVYTITIKDALGCTAVDSVQVMVNLLPNILISPPSDVCIGNSVALTASGGLFYSWSTGQTGTASISVTPPVGSNTYTVTGVDSNGCVNSSGTTVLVNSLPIPIISPPDSICFGASSSLTASGGLTYLWSNGETNSAITIAPPVGSHSYSVTITDANNCSNKDTTDLFVYPAVIAGISPPDTICPGTNASLTASGGTIYLWSTNETTASITVTPTVNTIYSVLITDANGCQGDTTVEIVINPQLTVNVNTPSPICIGDSVQIISSPTGINYTYTWTPSIPGGMSCTNCSNPLLTPATSTTYTLEVNDINGCHGDASISVQVNPLPTVSISPPDTICLGNGSLLTASGAFVYLWSNGQTGLSPGINPIPPLGSNTYTVIGIDANGCRDTNSTSVWVNDLPIATISPADSICIGASSVLTSSGGIDYAWSDGQTGQGITVLPVSGLNNYTVIVTDSNGCTDSETTTVYAEPIPQALTSNVDICEGQDAQLSATGGTSYLWTPPLYLNNPKIENPVSKPKNSLTYTVEVRSGTKCPPAYANATVIVHPAPVVEASADTTILAGTFAQLTSAANGISFSWSPPLGLSCVYCPNPTAAPLKNTVYIITTTDAYGCVDADTVLIEVDDLLTLYVPTAFTPYNYDVNNSVFYAYGVGIFKFEFYIFDRWGALVFETNDPSIGWDGTYNGSVVPQDVYVWLAKAVSITGKSISKTGPVTVVR